MFTTPLSATDPVIEPCSRVASRVEAQDVHLVGVLQILLPGQAILLSAEMLSPAGAHPESPCKLWPGPTRQAYGLFELQLFENFLNQLKGEVFQVYCKGMIAAYRWGFGHLCDVRR